MKKLLLSSALALVSLTATGVQAADYAIDTQGAHAFINFKIKHLGYSWLHGRFNTFDGSFSYDQEKPNESTIALEIDVASIDSNHAERDKHLRGEDFLNVEKHPKSSFKSTKIEFSDDTKASVTGEFMLNGVTKTINFPIEKVGEGKDPWGGYRAGFAGNTEIALKDYNIDYNLGPASTHVTLDFTLEGIRQ